MRDTVYKVSFFKNLVSSDGHPFRCIQEAISVRSQSPDEAIAAAQRRFENWRFRADQIEAIEDRERAEPVGSAGLDQD